MEEFLALLVILVVLGLAFSRAVRVDRRDTSWERPQYRVPATYPETQRSTPRPPPIQIVTDMSDPRNQMTAIAEVRFERQRLLNREEAKLLPLIERTVRKLNGGHRVMAQTSLGELLQVESSTPKDARDRAYASINSKRVDFVVIDRYGFMQLAIEYQGTGHFQPRSFMRDAVKREAIRKAGIPFLEVVADFNPDKVSAQIAEILRPHEKPQQTSVNLGIVEAEPLPGKPWNRTRL